MSCRNSTPWRRLVRDASRALRSWGIRPLPRLWEKALDWAEAQATGGALGLRVIYPDPTQVAQCYLLLLLVEMHRDRPWLTSQWQKTAAQLGQPAIEGPRGKPRKRAERLAAVQAPKALTHATERTPDGWCDQCETRYPAVPGLPPSTLCGCGGNIVRDYADFTPTRPTPPALPAPVRQLGLFPEEP